MSRSLRRGAAAALVLAAIVPLSACGAGNEPATLQIKPDNAATSVGNAKLNNIVVVAPAGSAGDYSGPATVTVNVANTGTVEDVLTGVTIAGSPAKLTDADGAALSGITLKPGQSVLLGAAGAPTAQAAGVKLSVGGYAPTAFTFKTAGQVSANAVVHPASDLYKGFGPKEAAKPSAAPSAAASASAGATAGASAGASAGATAGASAGASAPATAGTNPAPSASAH
ncbi:DUF461 domain-containing protein [Kitasatospora sp. NPDC088134]|uniref:DUF461 domain-containing protein n=1 Tax=Kitasatospora sp. NPDC088134 TaxID=3364071 RepID=UPI0037F44EA9